MKKSFIAIGVAGVIAIWLGGSWYSGQQVETRARDLIERSNKELAEYDMQMTLDEIKSSLFSSQVNYSLHIDKDDITDQPMIIAFHDTVEHGPFPFSRLKRFHLLPVMMRVHSSLAKRPSIPVNELLFKLAKNNTPYTAVTDISYSGDASSHISISPMEHSVGDVSINFSGSEIEAHYTRHNNRFFSQGKIGNLLYKFNDVFLLLNGLSWQQHESDTEKETASIQKMVLNESGRDIFNITNFTTTSKIKEQEELYQGTMSYSVDSVKLGGKEFGSSSLSMNFNRIDKQAIEYYQSASQQRLLSSKSPEIKLQELGEVTTKTVELLLNAGPEISIDPLMWKNSQGESQYQLQMKFAPNQSDGKLSAVGDALNSLQKVNSSLSISIPMATEVIATVNELQGKSKEQAQSMAKQQIAMLQSLAQAFKLATVKKDKLISTLNYFDGFVEVNGDRMTTEEFLNQYLSGLLSTIPDDTDSDSSDQ